MQIIRNLAVSGGLAFLVAYLAPLDWQRDRNARGGNDTTQVATDFQMRIQRYVELHRTLEGSVPTIAVSSDYAQVVAAIDALAAKIQAARQTARRGDIFTLAIEGWFRDMIAGALEDCDVEAILAQLNAENPPNVTFVPEINGRWPVGVSFGPVPPRILVALPELPDELQYRFLNHDLVLWDAHANIIVDFIKNLLPSLTVSSSERP